MKSRITQFTQMGADADNADERIRPRKVMAKQSKAEEV